MKIQQQNTRKTVPNFKKDQEHIAGLQVKLNALVSMFHVYSPFFIMFILITQPNFQASLRVGIEGSSQKTSKSSWSYLT